MSGRLALALAWLGAIATASLVALANRSSDAGIQSKAWIFLVLFSVPGVVIAVDFIRTRVILVDFASRSWFRPRQPAP